MSEDRVVAQDPGSVVATWVAAAASVSVADAYLGRRRSLRYPWPTTIEVVVNPESGNEKRFVAAAHDVSEGGVGLVCRSVMPIGARILLREADRGDDFPWLPARVVHSVPAAGGYRVGVQFELDRVE
jgi:hypothetical protein